MAGNDPRDPDAEHMSGIATDDDSLDTAVPPTQSKDVLEFRIGGLVSYGQAAGTTGIVHKLYDLCSDFVGSNSQKFFSDGLAIRNEKTLAELKTQLAERLVQPGQYARLYLVTEDGENYTLDVRRDETVLLASPVLHGYHLELEKRPSENVPWPNPTSGILLRNLTALLVAYCRRFCKEQFGERTDALDFVQKEFRKIKDPTDTFQFIIYKYPTEKSGEYTYQAVFENND